LSFNEALDRGAVPLRSFMLKQTRQTDLALFVKLAKAPPLESPEQVPMKVLVPAYVISELKTAFQIGFVVFIPFLIIDLVVSSVLMSMGMMMLSPVIISLPFKLMLLLW
jgi:flagellar biosynthetic protein FliP